MCPCARQVKYPREAKHSTTTAQALGVAPSSCSAPPPSILCCVLPVTPCAVAAVCGHRARIIPSSFAAELLVAGRLSSASHAAALAGCALCRAWSRKFARTARECQANPGSGCQAMGARRTTTTNKRWLEPSWLPDNAMYTFLCFHPWVFGSLFWKFGSILKSSCPEALPPLRLRRSLCVGSSAPSDVPLSAAARLAAPRLCQWPKSRRLRLCSPCHTRLALRTAPRRARAAHCSGCTRSCPHGRLTSHLRPRPAGADGGAHPQVHGRRHHDAGRRVAGPRCARGRRASSAAASSTALASVG